MRSRDHPAARGTIIAERRLPDGERGSKPALRTTRTHQSPMHHRSIRGVSFTAILALWGGASACVLTDPGALRFGSGVAAMEPVNGGGKTANGLLNGEYETRDKDGGVSREGSRERRSRRALGRVPRGRDHVEVQVHDRRLEARRSVQTRSTGTDGSRPRDSSGTATSSTCASSTRGQRVEEGAFLNGLRTGRWVTC